MKTVLIAHNYYKTSFASMSYHLANYLCEEGFRIIFISKDPYFTSPKEKRIGKGKLILYSWPKTFKSTSFKDFVFCLKLVKKYTPEVVIGHHNGAITSVIVSKLLLKKRVKTADYHHVCTNSFLQDHTGPRWKINFFLFRKKLLYNLFCNWVICPSLKATEDVKNNFNFQNTSLIPNPLPDRFKGFSHQLRHEKIIIGYLGRIVPCKNVLWLVDQFISYKASNPKTKIVLEIAGDGFQKEELIEKIGGNSCIIYKGNLTYNQVDDFINSLNFTIIPSTADNLPTVVTESLMLSVPPLVSKNIGSIDYLNNKKDSLFFNVSDEKDLRNTFETIEKLSEKDYQTLCKQARATYLRHFTMGQYFETMKKFIVNK